MTELPHNGQYYTIRELVEAKGTSLPVRSALLTMESRILALEYDLAAALRGTQHMTPRERTHADINEIAQAHGYTVEDVLGPSRRKKLVAVRRLCALMLRDRGFSTTETGRILNRCHTTIVYALNKEM